jgi:hypothetical protein
VLTFGPPAGAAPPIPSGGPEVAPTIDLETAKQFVTAYLDDLRVEGGLEIVAVREYPCGWVFSWNSSEYARTQDINHMLGGNIPILVLRSDGAMYSLGPMRSRYDPNCYPEGREELRRLG